MTQKDNSIWLFGYGSLIWRPDFAYLARSVGSIDGWTRRFWQGSHDHRGVPEAPGRVVTLVSDPAAQCTGMAYKIDAGLAAEIFTQLDYREKNGYQRLDIDCQLRGGTTVSCVTYIAGPANEAYLGEAPLADIARQIETSHGPSGSNKEYLLKLATALRELGISDDHVFALEGIVTDA
ncbi:MAG: gamma-glutamylcyclotransferase [Pseudomonadota bacterium]